MTAPVLAVERVGKTFTMHLQGGVRLPVMTGASLVVHKGECVALSGPSGVGKSSLLKMIHGGYAVGTGAILVQDGDGTVDVAQAGPREVLALRRRTIGYVSQFLRAVPRVAAEDVVAEPLVERGSAPDAARDSARAMLRRLNLPERLFGLPPATFSGGEQQRVNIARGFIAGHPLLLLDEPTASLDAANVEAVVALIEARKRAGTAILAIVHDPKVQARIADRVIDAGAFGA